MDFSCGQIGFQFKHRPNNRQYAPFLAYSTGISMTKCLLWLRRYIFWNAGGLGWSIGKEEYLQTGSHWHRSETTYFSLKKN